MSTCRFSSLMSDAKLYSANSLSLASKYSNALSEYKSFFYK